MCIYIYIYTCTYHYIQNVCMVCMHTLDITILRVKCRCVSAVAAVQITDPGEPTIIIIAIIINSY